MIEGPELGCRWPILSALNVAAFEDPDSFKKRVDQIVRQIRESKKAPGCDRIYAPGELEAETERRYREEGIPLELRYTGRNQAGCPGTGDRRIVSSGIDPIDLLCEVQPVTHPRRRTCNPLHARSGHRSVFRHESRVFRAAGERRHRHCAASRFAHSPTQDQADDRARIPFRDLTPGNRAV